MRDKRCSILHQVLEASVSTIIYLILNFYFMFICISFIYLSQHPVYNFVIYKRADRYVKYKKALPEVAIQIRRKLSF